MIGQLEELTLLALIRAGPASHAAKVQNALDETVTSAPQFAATFITLNRLVEKGMVSAQKDESGGRAKRLFTVTGEGRRAVTECARAFVALGGQDLVHA
ncbi:helix-turn-helix transcriptional regulator [Mesorhizobium sp. 43Arga]